MPSLVFSRLPYVALFALGLAACGTSVSGTGTPSDADKNAGNHATPSASDHTSNDSPTQPVDKSDTSSATSDSSAADPTDDPPTQSSGTPTGGADGAIDVPQATQATSSAEFVLSQNKKNKRLYAGDCPTSLSSSTDAPYVYVELKNSGTKRALTSVWVSSVASGPANTAAAAAVYSGSTPPSSVTQRQACLGRATYDCYSSPCTGAYPGFASSDGHSVEVPANGSVLVYIEGESTKTGSFKLNVRTDYLQ